MSTFGVHIHNGKQTQYFVTKGRNAREVADFVGQHFVGGAKVKSEEPKRWGHLFRFFDDACTFVIPHGEAKS